MPPANGTDQAAADEFLRTMVLPDRNGSSSGLDQGSSGSGGGDAPPSDGQATLGHGIAPVPGPGSSPRPEQRLHNIEAYLEANAPQPRNNSNSNASLPAGAITGTVRSAVAVSSLNEMAQAKGYTLKYNFTETSHAPVSFMGKLEIEGSGEVLILQRGYPSKRDAKAALAGMGLEVMERLGGRWGNDAGGMAGKRKEGSDDAVESVNWVGRLLGRAFLHPFLKDTKTPRC